MDPNLLIIKKTKLVYPSLSYKLSGLLFRIQNNLGRFCKEKIYSDAIEKLLNESDIKFEREKKINLQLADSVLTKNWADFVIDNKVILEIKAKNFITQEDYMQTKRYLHFLNLPLGLIVNFRQRLLKPKRVLNSEFRLVDSN